MICEKPFALDAAEADAMLDAATRAGVVALVGHEFRWARGPRDARARDRDGAIGEPRQFALVQYVPLVADPDDAGAGLVVRRGRGGGWLGASGSHLVDQVRTWLGEFAPSARRCRPSRDRPHGAEDSFVVRVTMANGVEGVLQQTAAVVDAARRRPDGGRRHRRHARGDERRGVLLRSRRSPRAAGARRSRAARAANASDDPRHRYTHLELGPYTRLCEALRARRRRRASRRRRSRSRRSPTASPRCGCSTRSARRPRPAAPSSRSSGAA